MKKLPLLILILLLTAESSALAGPYRFSDTPPVEAANDQNPSPVPEKSREFQFVEYSVTSSVRYPIVDALDTRRKVRSLDVNSRDEVPASSWFTPRLGYKTVSPEEMLKGPEIKGAPQKPYTIVKAKTQGNSPGFVIQDARGLKYLIKFDRSEYPALESTVNLAVNRLFWAFGYFVPEDYLIQFSPEDAKINEGVSQDDIDQVYIMSYADEDGTYRAVASLFLEGTILGPIAQRGTRKGDTNDTIAHENRRTLRGLRMFSAWLGNSGFRSDNTLEVYQGEPGKGFTVHYMLDFGEALGVHAIGKNRNWDGFEYFFSWGDLAKNFLTLGFPIKQWEDLKIASDSTVGNFETELFEPGKWKETTQFLPIRSSQPDDDYWAAKIIASVSSSHLEALFKAARHPDPAYQEQILGILKTRRKKIIEYAFGRVSPLEFKDLTAGKIVLTDLGAKHGVKSSEYRVRFLNAKGRKVSAPFQLAAAEALEIDLTQALQSAKGYLIVEVTAVRDGKKAPRAAQFHIRESNGQAKLAGIVR